MKTLEYVAVVLLACDLVKSAKDCELNGNGNWKKCVRTQKLNELEKALDELDTSDETRETSDELKG